MTVLPGNGKPALEPLTSAKGQVKLWLSVGTARLYHCLMEAGIGVGMSQQSWRPEKGLHS